jgi:transposase
MIMSDDERRKRFVELRGQGVSYCNIAKEIKASKSTLIRWSKELSLEISNAQAFELEGLQKEYQISKEHRVRVNGTQLGLFTDELLRRDLSEVTTPRLFEMQRRLMQEVQADCGDVEFTDKTLPDAAEKLREIFRVTDVWKG